MRTKLRLRRRRTRAQRAREAAVHGIQNVIAAAWLGRTFWRHGRA